MLEELFEDFSLGIGYARWGTLFCIVHTCLCGVLIISKICGGKYVDSWHSHAVVV